MTDIIDDAPDFQEKLMGYVRTQKGFMLAAEMALGLVVLACYAYSSYGAYAAMPSLVLTLSTLAFFRLLSGPT